MIEASKKEKYYAMLHRSNEGNARFYGLFSSAIISQRSTTAICFGGMNAAEFFPFILCGFIINEQV